LLNSEWRYTPTARIEKWEEKHVFRRYGEEQRKRCCIQVLIYVYKLETRHEDVMRLVGEKNERFNGD
jgi:hypothetical protein